MLAALAGPLAPAQEDNGAGAGASIIGPVADGTPPPPPPPKEMPAFQVEATTTHRLRDHKVIMLRVADPGLPDPPPPPPPPTKDQMDAFRASAWWQEMVARHGRTKFLFVSATVYDHQKTFVRWCGNGTPARSFAAWSNVDFNHFSGMGGFEADSVCYSLFMGVGNMDTARLKAQAARAGREFQEPQPPPLPADGPGFVLVEGDAQDTEGMAPIVAIHDLYRVEKDRLAAAYEGRERAHAEREAWLKANPPVPQDSVIRFWPGKGSRYHRKETGP